VNGSEAGRSRRAEAAFRARVEELGGRVVEPTWLGKDKPHRVICAEGHECEPWPGSVQQGRGICRTCAGRDSVAAWSDFRVRVEELGGCVIELEWLGSLRPHRVICAEGHECTPRPNHVQQGRGICRTCAGQDSAVAWAAFRVRVEELGGRVVEPTWLGNGKPHRVICAEGHECAPRPAGVQQGKGICRTCTGRDSVAAWAAFRARVEELGGRVVEPTWLGNGKPHRVTCAEGHECAPRPAGVQQGKGICLTCVGRDSVAAWAAFRARVEELGGCLIEPDWLGDGARHRVICAEGHECRPYPTNVRQGGGICRICAGQAWDRFYVVTNPSAAVVKLGVTSGDFRPRLGRHRAAGYVEVLRLREVPDADALERAALETLRLAEFEPVKGREYFDLSALPVILDVVDHWLIGPTGAGR
jgi:formylmethanofuran dehydrogenase subunit E